MNRLILLASVVVLALAGPASAIDFGLGLFKKKPKTDTIDKTKAVITTLQSDPDEKKRRAAAEELRTVDPRTVPEAIPALIASLQKDPSVMVRSEAAESISKMKTISQPAAVAMEAASQTDPSPEVREALKNALWQYHLNGYRTPTAAIAPKTGSTGEPPIASGRPSNSTTSLKPPSNDGTFRPITSGLGKGIYYQPTGEPPLAKPKPVEIPLPPPSIPVPNLNPSVVTPPTLSPIPGPIPSLLPPPVPTPMTPTIPVPPITIPVPTDKPKF